MNGRRFHRVLLQIGLGYSRTLRRIASGLLLVAATVSLSAAIVFPLWYFSTRDRTGYTLVVLGLAGAVILFLIARRMRAFWELASEERTARVRRLLVRLLAVLGYLVGLYVIFGLYVVGLLPVAVPLSIVYLLVLGYSLYARRSKAGRLR